jgi:hypothetical protein
VGEPGLRCDHRNANFKLAIEEFVMKLKDFVAISFLILALGLTGCGGGSSAQVQPPPPAVPTISAITPPTAVVGSADLKVTLTGSNFAGAPHNFSQAAWVANGSATLLTTTFVSSTQLAAVVPAALLADPITAQVLLETGDPMGDLPLTKSNSVSFSVSTPPFSITSILPTSATVGSPDLTLTIAGSNLDLRHAGTHQTNTDVVWFANGSDSQLSLIALSSTTITAKVPAALLAKPGNAGIHVEKWYFADDTPFAVSNILTFTVTSGGGGAAIISPSTETLGPRGTRQFVFTIAGNNTNAIWEVDEGASGGTITSGGFYTAASNAGTYHVSATSVADASKSATAAVSVLPSGFAATGSMNKARSGHTATLLKNGRVLILGGGDNTAELFDPATGSFIPAGTMTTLRFGATVTLLASGKVLITGGFGTGTSQLPRLNTAELYDPQSGTFTPTGSMSVGRIGHTATLLNDGKVLIAGGTDSSGGGGAAAASAELYDPSTDTFTVTGSMASERAGHTATLLASGEILIAGGWNGHAADSTDDPPWDPLFAELFHESSGSFTETGSMSTTRIGHSAVALPDGKVVVLGGVPSIQNIHEQPPAPQYSELYDPVAGTFSSAGNFTLSPTKYTATLLNDGMVLIAGGEQAGIAVTSAELVDPATETLSAAGGLVTARKDHTATRLNDGRVLVTGGTDSNGNALASAELYQ